MSKSTWTLNKCGKNPQLGRKNLQKWKAASKAEGAPFDVFVFDRYGKILSILRFFPNETVTTYQTFGQSLEDMATSGIEKFETFDFPTNLRNLDYEETEESPSDMILNTFLMNTKYLLIYQKTNNLTKNKKKTAMIRIDYQSEFFL